MRNCVLYRTRTHRHLLPPSHRNPRQEGLRFRKVLKGAFLSHQPASSRTNVDCVARYMEKFFATGKLRRVKVAVVKYKIAVFIERLFLYPVFFQSPSCEARRVKLLLLSCSCVSLCDSATVSALGMLTMCLFWNLE